MCDGVLCSRIAVFSITVLHDERVVVVAEQRPDSTEEDSFQWMSRVLQVHTQAHKHTSTRTHFLWKIHRMLISLVISKSQMTAQL